MLAVSIATVDYPARADIRRLIGEAEWFSLPKAARTRFAEHAASARYQGTFDEVRASFAGKLLAMCCRLLGTPVAPFTGTNVPATVNVFATPDGGIAWQRISSFQGARPASSKASNACRAKERWSRRFPPACAWLSMYMRATASCTS